VNLVGKIYAKNFLPHEIYVQMSTPYVVIVTEVRGIVWACKNGR